MGAREPGVAVEGGDGRQPDLGSEGCDQFLGLAVGMCRDATEGEHEHRAEPHGGKPQSDDDDHGNHPMTLGLLSSRTDHRTAGGRQARPMRVLSPN
jgi:hypothetical protein